MELLDDIDAVFLLPLPQGWPDPFRAVLQRDTDYISAFTAENGLWIRFVDGSRYIVPFAHIIAMIPGDWP